MIALLSFFALLLLAIPAHAQSFTRGQWNSWGSGSLGGAQFVGSGVAPYDVFADGTTSVNGRTMQAAENGQPPASLFAFSSGGIYVPSIQQFVSLLTAGHDAGGSNEVNVFDLGSGTWSNVVKPTVRLYMPINGTWPFSIAYGGIHLTVPLGLVDTGYNYSANIAPSQNGAQIACVNRQIYGGISDMPGTNSLFLYGGFGYWNALLGTASIGCTYNYVTKKYQFLDAETWPSGAETNVTSAAWDPDHSRVLFTTELSLYSYVPSDPLGGRVHSIVSGDGCGSDNCSLYTLIYDAKRHWLLLFGGGSGTGTTQGRYYDFSAGPSSPTSHTFTLSGASLSTDHGPAVLYDPIADAYAHHAGGQTIVTIIPSASSSTWTATSTTYTGGSVVPSTANEGGSSCCGASEYYRWFYWSQQDAYVAIPQATDSGVFVFPPIRNAVLAFSDLTQGNRAGNGDTSHGQTAGVNGVIVTVWGYNLGAAQGPSTLTIGGVGPSAIYYWGNATPPNCGPAALSNQYQKLQCIVFQIASTTPTGNQSIVATIGGLTSTSLPFLVTTAGTIWFAGPGACGTGTYTSPYCGIQNALLSMAVGDTLYVLDGTSAPNNIDVDVIAATPTNPTGILAYPGAVVTVGDGARDGNSGFDHTGGLVYSKLTFIGNQQVVTIGDGSRLIGSKASCPNGDSLAGCIGGWGSTIFILGNEITNAGITNPANFEPGYHTIYLYGRRFACPCFLESGKEVGWNYIHDNAAFRAVNIFNGSGTDSNPMSDNNVHDNVILNQEGDGILFGRAVVGTNSATNNLIIDAGLHNVNTDTSAGGTCIDFQMSEANGGGAAVSHAATVVTVSNNTMLNCGRNTGGSNSGVGVFMFSQISPAVARLFDNIAYQQSVGFPYVTPSGPSPNDPSAADPTKYKTNLWFGAGAAPSWDTSPVNADPKLVAATGTYDLHLQAGSPAIGTGIVLTTPSYDFDGRTRPTTGAWDIGAYEFAGTSGILGTPRARASGTWKRGAGAVSPRSHFE